MEQRLRWHVERCLAWLHVAGDEQLMMNDEPFEVPQCPEELLNTRFRVVHDEGHDTWPSWKGRDGQYGELQWGLMPGFEKTIVAEKFLDDRGEMIRVCRRAHQPTAEPWVGYWWLWPSPMVLPPWHTPGTWAELRRAGARMKVDVDRFIRWMAHRVGGKKAVIVLIGYPIPTLWNGNPVEVHWQAIFLPDVPTRIKPTKGFRPSPNGSNERLLQQEIFGGAKKLSYLRTSNWHPDRLQARGRFPSDIRASSIAIIGAGALGSTVAEILARCGVANILIVDHDDLEPGNLVRHTLIGADLGCNKATATAARLQGAAPMSSISAHAAMLPSGDRLQQLLEPFDIVIDCTGEDEVLRRLAEAWWSIPRRFLSASLGFAAKRLFLFGAQACAFPFDEFAAAVKPWLAAERSQWSTAGETLEGAGCWSPLFPARCDDVWLSAVATVKYLEFMAQGTWVNALRVLEQSLVEGTAGYQAVEFDALSASGANVPQEGGAL
ncbi:MAG: ThiF family adenylyltransferase [Spirulinaceae cyanobacterium SM2_1_0]|nr:ThiF family adenylyltransferase [Spirulinaceae cyanobacterium SM2_1_0]